MKGENIMCFVKSSKSSAAQVAAQVAPEPEVIRKQANASLTKNKSVEQGKRSGYAQNIKTSALGLTDTAQTTKNTLLGE